METVVGVLKMARDIFKTKNLHKGGYGPNLERDFPYMNSQQRRNVVSQASDICTGAAIYGCGATPLLTRPALLMFAQANALEYIYGIPLWNDNAERTKEDVLIAFDIAIDYLELSMISSLKGTVNEGERLDSEVRSSAC